MCVCVCVRRPAVRTLLPHDNLPAPSHSLVIFGPINSWHPLVFSQLSHDVFFNTGSNSWSKTHVTTASLRLLGDILFHKPVWLVFTLVMCASSEWERKYQCNTFKYCNIMLCDDVPILKNSVSILNSSHSEMCGRGSFCVCLNSWQLDGSAVIYL